MAKPILKDNNLVPLVKDSINLIKELDKDILINFESNKSKVMLNSDSEQLSRVFFNLIKNSIESILDKKLNDINLKGNIDITLNDNLNDIDFSVIDNGLGFEVLADNLKNILNPYFTTKKKGTGLGLAIVNKTINDHNGSVEFISTNKGAKVQIKFIKWIKKF